MDRSMPNLRAEANSARRRCEVRQLDVSLAVPQQVVGVEVVVNRPAIMWIEDEGVTDLEGINRVASAGGIGLRSWCED